MRSRRGDDARIGSVGVAQTGIDVVVAGPGDLPLPAGESGEVLVRGPTVMAGYWRNPEASAVTLANGWLHTGDIGALDADGFLTLKDRSKDLIISGGSNIYPREVEEVLLSHPDVVEAAVIGRAHPEWGEEVVACVVAHPDAANPAARAVLERGPRRALSRAHRAFQAAEGLHVPCRSSEEQRRQGAEDGAARAAGVEALAADMHATVARDYPFVRAGSRIGIIRWWAEALCGRARA